MVLEVEGRFKWRTAEGRVLEIEEMKTSHVFNSMKMLYNHLGYVHGWPTFWFTHHYPDYIWYARNDPILKLVKPCVVFILEIERRGDLPDRYREPYRQIIRFLYTKYGPKVDKLTAPYLRLHAPTSGRLDSRTPNASAVPKSFPTFPRRFT